MLIVADDSGLRRLKAASHITSSGEPVSLHHEEGDLGDALRLIADVSDLNVVVLPGVHGKLNLDPVPAGIRQCLAISKKNRARSQACARSAGFDEVAAFFERVTGLPVVADENFSEPLTFKLVNVPWDQALDLVTALEGLRFVVKDDVIRIGRRELPVAR